ncbi:hypothetical protein [Variovorax sp. Sphag1AA]|uniref:hypothetical protein n=1 Tax=Variovorax sp. Sphag1AA TaxID=2587027 RepID=UPI001611EB6C|nr:hypothetical protein [Variovorax sp. Sphag1AA]MBB3181287.1 hypothetical protein [Variovorax sp. Sphag1AA]
MNSDENLNSNRVDTDIALSVLMKADVETVGKSALRAKTLADNAALIDEKQ